MSVPNEGVPAPHAAPGRPPRSPLVKAIVGLAIVATGWHLFASFLWIAPSSPLREVVPGNALSGYMLPMFGQSWSVFAPEPVNGDFYFEVRARTGAHGAETEWVRATDVEMSMTMGNLFPPRAGIMASELANKYKARFEELGDPGKQTAAADFTVEGWQAVLQSELRAHGTDAGAEPDSSVDGYLDMEASAAAYATQVARALWGDDVSAVQYRAGRQNVIPFADRGEPDAVRPAAIFVEPGWRGPVVAAGQDGAEFARVFRAQAERIGAVGGEGETR